MKSIRVLIADDSPTALRSVRDYLEFAGGFEIVGTASDGLHAVHLASVHKPDLVLLDLSMPRVNGLEAAEQIRLSSPDLRVIIFSELYGSLLPTSAAATARTVSCTRVIFRTVCSRKLSACFLRG